MIKNSDDNQGLATQIITVHLTAVQTDIDTHRAQLHIKLNAMDIKAMVDLAQPHLFNLPLRNLRATLKLDWPGLIHQRQCLKALGRK